MSQCGFCLRKKEEQKPYQDIFIVCYQAAFILSASMGFLALFPSVYKNSVAHPLPQHSFFPIRIDLERKLQKQKAKAQAHYNPFFASFKQPKKKKNQMGVCGSRISEPTGPPPRLVKRPPPPPPPPRRQPQKAPQPQSRPMHSKHATAYGKLTANSRTANYSGRAAPRLSRPFDAPAYGWLAGYD